MSEENGHKDYDEGSRRRLGWRGLRHHPPSANGGNVTKQHSDKKRTLIYAAIMLFLAAIIIYWIIGTPGIPHR
jgi:hypothetical protein